jgi:hypothetical protein
MNKLPAWNEPRGTCEIPAAFASNRARCSFLRRVARALLSEHARRGIYSWLDDFRTPYLKDRTYLNRELLPTVGRCRGKALFIGCRKYTKPYPARLAAYGTECWTN